MKNNLSAEQVLEKAIQKAIEGGYPRSLQYVKPGVIMDGDVVVNVPAFIFNHDFAKSLWGDGTSVLKVNQTSASVDDNFGWERHLQQMVIADDPIKYLGENL